MTINAKIILNRAKKGKILSIKEEEILFKPISGNMNMGIEYVNDILKTRSDLFEKRFEEYCLSWNSMWGIKEDEILFYIIKIIKGPWINIEKYLNDAHLQRYKLFLQENGFHEHLI